MGPKLDLVAVSVATNTAFNFGRGICDEYARMFPSEQDFNAKIDELYRSVCAQRGVKPFTGPRVPNFEAYEELNKTLFLPNAVLSGFQEELGPNIAPVYNDGYGTYDVNEDRSSMAPQEKFMEDKALMLQILPQFHYIMHLDIPVEDAMMRGVRDLGKMKKDPPPIWLAFAIQCFLDINHIFRHRIDHGMNELLEDGEKIRSSINDSVALLDRVQMPNWPRGNKKGLQAVVGMIDWIIQRNEEDGLNPPGDIMWHYPVFCGLLLYQIRVIVHDIGVQLDNTMGSCLYASHLYNAVTKVTGEELGWSDMNLFFGVQQTTNIFVRDYPKDVEDCFKRFCLALGVPASQLMAKSDQVRSAKRKPRTIETGGGLTEISNSLRRQARGYDLYTPGC